MRRASGAIAIGLLTLVVSLSYLSFESHAQIGGNADLQNEAPRAPYVKRGLYRVYPGFEHAARVAQLTIHAPVGRMYFVKLEDALSGEPVMSFFAYGGSNVRMVPLGTFTIKYAEGTVWYDDDRLFGSDTVFARIKSEFVFQEEGDSFSSHSLSLAGASRQAALLIRPDEF